LKIDLFAKSALLFSLPLILSTTILQGETFASSSIDKNEELTSDQTSNNADYIGVNMAGYDTRIAQFRGLEAKPPMNYYEDSLKIISNSGMNLVRYQVYWEAYENNPDSFIKELIEFATIADKWNLNVIYDNQQFHVSSWMDRKQGTGFPASLFIGNASNDEDSKYNEGSLDVRAETWWTDWWNRSIKDSNGKDGWTLQADFLKKIVSVVDDHPSTLGYEILNEPDVYNNDQWKKVGNYNSFLTNELRKVTQKTIVFDRQLRPDYDNAAIPTPENMAKMAPDNKTNVVFKATLYGLPSEGSEREKRLNDYVRAASIMKIPLYIGEFGIKNTESLSKEDMDKKKMTFFVRKFTGLDLWGWSYWRWDFKHEEISSYNLININEDRNLQTTKYFEYLKDAIFSFYPA
jgi:Cellulase (glycosyl hydrolase family 5)